MTSATSTRGLLFGQEHRAFGLAGRRRRHRLGVRGTDAEIVMDAAAQHLSLQQRPECIGEKQVGHGL